MEGAFGLLWLYLATWKKSPLTSISVRRALRTDMRLRRERWGESPHCPKSYPIPSDRLARDCENARVFDNWTFESRRGDSRRILHSHPIQEPNLQQISRSERWRLIRDYLVLLIQGSWRLICCKTWGDSERVTP